MYMTPVELIEMITSRVCNDEIQATPATIAGYSNLVSSVSDGMLFTFDMDHYDSTRAAINPVGVHWLKARQFLELAEQELKLAEHYATQQGV
tara:strand:- start:357 stop:632 length:276 start_codon:yes stop_codon:yes gene_type:complete